MSNVRTKIRVLNAKIKQVEVKMGLMTPMVIDFGECTDEEYEVMVAKHRAKHGDDARLKYFIRTKFIAVGSPLNGDSRGTQ